MMNNIFVNLFTIMTLMMPISMQTLVASTTNANETEDNSEVTLQESDHELLTLNTIMQEILVLISGNEMEAEEATEIEQPVTTMETARAAVADEEPELTAEEEKALAFAEWKSNLPLYDSETPQADFIEKIAPAAVLIANAQGIYPSVMIAQAALESSWGQSGLAESYNNLMGTKGNVDGKSVTVRTREVQNGESVYINAGFTIYDSWGHSLFHYGSLMKNGLSWSPEYYSGTWVENTESYKDATAWLQGRYASDTSYASKLNQTIESFNLDQYDEIEPYESELESALEKLYTLNNE